MGRSLTNKVAPNAGYVRRPYAIESDQDRLSHN